MEKRNDRKRKHSRRNRRLLIVLAVFLLLALTTGGLIARYTTQNKKEAQMKAADFHVSSDYLDETSKNAEYKVSDWGNHGIEIQLYNYEKENLALIAQENISYVIETDYTNWDVKITDSQNETEVSENQVCTLSGDGENRKIQKICLAYKGEGEPSPVAVTVRTTAPYEKVLTAKFELVGKKLPDYSIEDKGTYCLVTIHSNDYENGITIEWDADKFSPDNTNPQMSLWKDTDLKNTLSVQSYHTYELIFFENKAVDYSEKQGTGTTISVPEKAGE